MRIRPLPLSHQNNHWRYSFVGVRMDADDPRPKEDAAEQLESSLHRSSTPASASAASSSSHTSSTSSSSSSVLGVFKKLGKAMKKAVVGSSKDKDKDKREDRTQSSLYGGRFAAVKVASPSPTSSLKGSAPVLVARAVSEPITAKAPRSLKQLYDDGFELAVRAKAAEADGDLHGVSRVPCLFSFPTSPALLWRRYVCLHLSFLLPCVAV